MADQKTYLFHAFMSIAVILLLPLNNNAALAQNSGDESESTLPSFKFGGFLQQQFIVDQSPDSPVRFSIHRARLGVTGFITKRISVNLIGGYSEPPDNTPRLVNAFIDFDIHPLLQVRTGQFLLPFGLEGPQPIFLNPAIERTYTIRRLNTFTMFRDVGIQLSGRRSLFSYAFAFVNGAGANNTEQIEPKDVIGRIGFKLTDHWGIGISGHLGYYQSAPPSEDYEPRKRFGVDISYLGKPFFMRGEYLLRRDDLSGGDNRKMHGGYLLGGYQVSEEIETIARYEIYDPNSSINDDELNALTLGANYYFVGNTRLSINYAFIKDRLNPDFGNILTLQMQLAL